ncbi:hypothetical protein LCGC14_0799190 [marine sediment metagenome]|uniref:Uncharacterized protein n=1 Tax=marine sediment metagenome TaxID=412755 RepID=A0A0F9SA76_9ZZZZ
MDKAMNNLKPLADEYGEINAQLADLKKRQKSIKAVFEQADVKELEGLTFRIVVSQVDDSSCPDYKTICEKLEPSRQMIAANQKVTKGYTRINVYGRTGDE